jgi:hypothetical protein
MQLTKKDAVLQALFFVRDVPERVISKEEAVGQRRAKSLATREKEHLAKHESVTGVLNAGAS